MSIIDLGSQTNALDGKTSGALMKYNPLFKYGKGSDEVNFTIFEGKIYEAIVEDIPINTPPPSIQYWKLFKSGGGVLIDDSVVSTDTTWSSAKIMEELDGLSTDNIFPELSLFKDEECS